MGGYLKSIQMICFTVSLLFVLSACGGGSSNSSETETTESLVVVSAPEPSDGLYTREGSSRQILRVNAPGATSGIFYYDNDDNISYSTTATVNGDYLEVTIPYTGTNEGMSNSGTKYWYVEATNSVGTTRYPSSGNLQFAVSPLFSNQLTLVSGTLNGTTITPSNPEITVVSNNTISGTLSITAYNSHESNAVFPICATPSWGDRQTSHWTVSSTADPGNSNHTVTVDLTAPSTAGTYYIFVSSAAEIDCGDVMSGSNWSYEEGEAWNDGNDVVEWNSDAIQGAISNGTINVQWLGNQGLGEINVGASAVKIIVN